MKIVIYKDTLANQRGADRAVMNFASALAERGYAVKLVEKSGLEAALVEQFDVLVVTGSNEAVDLDRLGYFERVGRAKTILQLHLAPRGFFKWKHPIRNWRIRRAFNKFDAVQVLCSSYVDEFKRLAPHPQVITIGNYSDFPPPATPLPLGAPEHYHNSRKSVRPKLSNYDKTGSLVRTTPSHTILYPAATLSNDKSQLLLIRAFARLVREFPDWQVRLLGKDTTKYAKACRKEIARLGLGDQIKIVGFTNDLAGEYSRATFIAFPSRLEGFPLAVLEAAKFALPTLVTSRLPGVDDIVRNGETGLVVPGTVPAYAAGLRQLMTDAGLRQQMGERARNYCAEHYSRGKILDQWEALMASMLGA